MFILLYILDSLRRDFLGCYGDKGAISPNLDMFAAQATRFTHGYAAAPWSKASGAAMFTGDLPRAIRMAGLTDSLPPDVPTIAHILQQAGFTTLALSANPFIAHDFGMLKGFATTIEAFRPGVLPQEPFFFHANHFVRLADTLSVDPAALVLARSAALHTALLDHLTDDPTFALCWSMDTHAPFFVRGERTLFDNPLERMIPAADNEWLQNGLTSTDLTRLYRDMIAYNDQQFGLLVAELQQRGVWEDALIMVAGDHGEAFGEHGMLGHTHGLWEEQITVPLLVKFPRQQAGIVCNTPVSLYDLAPTLRHLATGDDTPLITDALGVNLQSTLSGALPNRTLSFESATGWGVRQDAWKLFTNHAEQPPLLFNIETDLAERIPLRDATLRADLTATAQAIHTAAEQRAHQWGAPPKNVLDPTLAARLRALGYL